MSLEGSPILAYSPGMRERIRGGSGQAHLGGPGRAAAAPSSSNSSSGSASGWVVMVRLVSLSRPCAPL